MATKRRRLNRYDWLERALDVVAREGHLSIASLTEALGVTEGSFYWHFENRSDFVLALVTHWAEGYTEVVAKELDRLDEAPQELLLRLMQVVTGRNLARFDLGVRAWARVEPAATERIREVDAFRFEVVRSLFVRMGFDEAEASTRTRALVVYLSMERFLNIPGVPEGSPEGLRRLHAFFVRP